MNNMGYRNQGQNSGWFSAMLLFSLVGSGCQLTAEEQEALSKIFRGAGSDYSGAPPSVAPACFNERFVQPEGTITKSVDLLFVTDTSGSLEEERGRVADGIGSFVGELPEDVDYQIAVMLAHGSRSNHSGRLWKHGNHPYVLSSKDMSLSRIRRHLISNLTNVSMDWHGDGGEEGLYSLNRALDHGPLTSSRAKGFFREDAALAVIFIADENDICAEFPEGVVPVWDPDRLEASAKARDCEGISPSSVYARVKDLQGDRPFLIGGILYNNHETYLRHGENEYGYGYIDLIRLANGISVDMAGSRYNEGLAEIGSLASMKLRLVTEFTLARPEIDPETIEVYVDGAPAEFTYSAEMNEIHLSSGGMARSVVDMNYCLKPEPSPEPTSEPSPEPSPEPTSEPSPEPTPEPTSEPSPEPTPCEGFGCGGGTIGV